MLKNRLTLCKDIIAIWSSTYNPCKGYDDEISKPMANGKNW